MKRILCLILSLALMLVFCACGGENQQDKTPDSGFTGGKLPANPPLKPDFVEVGENGSRTDDAVGFQLNLPEIGEKIVVFETNKGNIYMRLFEKSAPITVTNFVALVECGYYNGITFHRVIKDFMIQGGDPSATGGGGDSVWRADFEDEFNANLLNIRGSVAMANAGRNTNGSQFFINQKSTTESKSTFNYGVLYAQLKASSEQTLVAQYEKLKNAYGETFTADYPTKDDYIKETIDNVIAKNYILSETVPEEAWKLYEENGGNITLDGAFKNGQGGHTVFAQVFAGMDVVDTIAAVDVNAQNDKPLSDVVITKAYTIAVTGEILALADKTGVAQ